MISLDFDLNEMSNSIDIHELDGNLMLVAHNGYSYTRILLTQEVINKLIKKLKRLENEQDENELAEFNSAN